MTTQDYKLKPMTVRVLRDKRLKKSHSLQKRIIFFFRKLIIFCMFKRLRCIIALDPLFNKL